MKKMVSGFISKTQAYKDRESNRETGETCQIGVDTTAVCSFASTFRWKSRMLRALKRKCKVQRVKWDSTPCHNTETELWLRDTSDTFHVLNPIRKILRQVPKRRLFVEDDIEVPSSFLPSLFQPLAVSVTTLDQDNITKNPIIERSKRRQHEALCLVSCHPSSLTRMQKVEGERGGSTFAPEISGPQLWRQT